MTKKASVEVIMAQDGVDGEVKAFDRAGKEIALPHRIVVSPFFFRADALANIAYGRVLTNGDAAEVHKGILTLSGKTGKLAMQDRSARAVPSFVAKVKGTADGVAGEEIEAEDEEIEYEEVDDDGDDPEDGT